MRYFCYDAYDDPCGVSTDLDDTKVDFGRTLRQVARDNDGYIEDENGTVVYDSADEDEQ